MLHVATVYIEVLLHPVHTVLRTLRMYLVRTVHYEQPLSCDIVSISGAHRRTVLHSLIPRALKDGPATPSTLNFGRRNVLHSPLKKITQYVRTLLLLLLL